MKTLTLPKTKEIPLTLQILFDSLFLALCAQISIPLPFTPIPLTGQPFGVMLVGAFLGPRAGATAALAYLVEGAIGFPVWAGGGAGFQRFLSPAGGYLLAYPLQAYLSGHFRQSFIGLIFVCALQLSLGSLWLGTFVGMSQAFPLGFFPFIGGDILKAYLVRRIYAAQN
jgi:biotin transport system substrate-specific component